MEENLVFIVFIADSIETIFAKGAASAHGIEVETDLERRGSFIRGRMNNCGTGVVRAIRTFNCLSRRSFNIVIMVILILFVSKIMIFLRIRCWGAVNSYVFIDIWSREGLVRVWCVEVLIVGSWYHVLRWSVSSIVR